MSITHTLFDVSNILGGIVLAIGALGGLANIGSVFTKIAETVEPYKAFFGWMSLIFGVIFLFQPGCAIHDIAGIILGITLLKDELRALPAIGDFLADSGNKLTQWVNPIGIAGLVVGILGLLNWHILC